MAARSARHLSTLILVAAAMAGCAQAPATRGSPAHFDPATLAKGAELSALGDCRGCHTVDGAAAFAGGRPLTTPFGTLYSTNITPHAETGIGRWSLDDFRRALHEGIDREGHRLYPAFPYDHFTRMTDADIDALYAFIMTREPAKARAPRNHLVFPANVRPLLVLWDALFLDDRRYAPDATQNAQWNRGAYLVEGVGHCGACHTPRNIAGAEKRSDRFAGGEAEGWHAPALGTRSSAPIPWTSDALFHYLRHGFDPDHGLAAGPMSEVIDGLGTVPEDDVRAIVAYLTSLPAQSPPNARDTVAAAEQREFDAAGHHARDRASETGASAAKTQDAGEAIFEGACAICHYAGNALPAQKPVPLALATSVNATTPRDVVRIVANGLHPEPGESGVIMPGFRDALTDAQLIAVVEYVRARFSDRTPWSDVESTVRGVTQETSP
ncbi:MAG TPA: cytochrome c [Casimicrobiaceae bacterium]|nr:cytochrome c [Casimicrobiaceae bacterium]